MAKPSGAAAVDASPASPPVLDPLITSRALEPLVVDKHRDAIVSVPFGARTPRPVVVALHGNYDRPEWQCEVWRKALRAHAFILCPRGIPRGDAPRSEDRWTYGALQSVSEEIDAGLVALRARFVGYVDDGPVTFIGFSLGAILGRILITREPGRFGRAVLIEGGYEPWANSAIEKHSETKLRVVLACGQHACRQAADRTAKLLEKGGVPARSAFEKNVGHTYDGAVARAVSAQLSWLFEGDERWPDFGDNGTP